MIYGVIPIGGKGQRLGLPYSKEMLPQKGYDFFNPIANHLVEKMICAGARKIVFVHGQEFKRDVLDFFIDSEFYVHIKQNSPGFAQVLQNATDSCSFKSDDKVLFGLPDSIFQSNPFIEMLRYPGICTGLFVTTPNSRVDRLINNDNRFDVKSSRNSTNSDHFWGIIKFDYQDINKFIEDQVLSKTSEIGEILNMYQFSKVYGGHFIDIGTWENYNIYLSQNIFHKNNNFSPSSSVSGDY